jgi:hypothetical protein
MYKQPGPPGYAILIGLLHMEPDGLENPFPNLSRF